MKTLDERAALLPPILQRKKKREENMNMIPLYKVTDPQTGNLVMIAPLRTLRDAFKLHDSALTRVATEARDGVKSEVFFNYGRTYLGYAKIIVEAVGE